MEIGQEIEPRTWRRAMECNGSEHAGAVQHHASIRDGMVEMGDHRRHYSSHQLHHHAMDSCNLANIGGGGSSPLDSATMAAAAAAAALLLQRSSSASSQYVLSQMSSQITHDDDADFSDSSASKPSRPPPDAAACSLTPPSPPLMSIPRLETPDRTPPDSFDDTSRFSAGNLFYGSRGGAAWHTWGSDLELAGSLPMAHDGRMWRPGGGRFSDFLLPPAASQGTSLNLASGSPMHGECPPWSPSLLDLNLQIPADFHHLFASGGDGGGGGIVGTGEDSFSSYMAGFSVASAQCGGDAGVDQHLNHILGCSSGRDYATGFGLSEVSVGVEAVTGGAGESTIGGGGGMNVNVLQMKEEDGSSTVDCFPLDCFGFDLSSCSSNFFYPDYHPAAVIAASPALHVNPSDSPMLDENYDAAAPPPFLQQPQRALPELLYTAQSPDFFCGGSLPGAVAYSGTASASNKNRQPQYSLEAAYSASTTTTTTTATTATSGGDVCWDGTSEGLRRRRRGGGSSGGGGKNGGGGDGCRNGGVPAGTNTHRGTSERVTELTLQELSQYFNMPITQASKELKVGLTVLKKKCREFGIPRWPHRKMKSLESLITNIQDLAGEHGGKGSARVLNAVKELEEQKRLMEEMPGIELAERTKRLRQACFKASYKKRRLLLSQQQQQNQQTTTNSMD